MVYMCVICTVEQPPLVALTREHWNALEALVSSSVDLTPLKRISLLLACSGCVRQLQSLAVFRSIALKGVRHLLTCLHLVQTQNEMESDPLSLPIKEEPADSLLSVRSYVPMEIELPMVKPEEDIKPEPSLEGEARERRGPGVTASLDIEDNIPVTTVVRPELFANITTTCQTLPNTQATPVRSDEAKVATFTHGPMRSTPGGGTKKLEPLTPLGIQANAKQFQICQRIYDPQLRLVQVLPFDNIPVEVSFAPVQNKPIQPPPPKKLPRLAMKPATKTATFSHRPAQVPVTSAAGSTGKPVPDNTEQPTDSKLTATYGSESSSAIQRLQDLIAKYPKETPNANAKAVREPKSTYFIRKLSDCEMMAEREAARRAPEFAEATHKCGRCLVAFQCEREKEIHDGTVHSSAGTYLCGVCDHPESSLPALRAHIARHSTRYCCVYCLFRTPDETVIKEHCCDPALTEWKPSNFHKGLFKKPKPKPTNPVRCKECYAAFANDEKLKKHMDRAHSEPSGPHICKICNKAYKTARSLYSHTLNHKRKEVVSVDTINPERFCAACAKQFDSPSAYRAHMLTRRHAGNQHWQFQCDICGRRFPNKSRIEMHMQMVHLKLEPYKCELCTRGFNGRGALRRHRAAHAPPPRRAAHVCHVCARSFTIKKSLQEHLLAHEGKRPHACPLCPATFTYSAALYTHNRLKHLKIKGNWKKKPKKNNTTKPAATDKSA